MCFPRSPPGTNQAGGLAPPAQAGATLDRFRQARVRCRRYLEPMVRLQLLRAAAKQRQWQGTLRPPCWEVEVRLHTHTHTHTHTHAQQVNVIAQQSTLKMCVFAWVFPNMENQLKGFCPTSWQRVYPVTSLDSLCIHIPPDDLCTGPPLASEL